MKICSLNAFFLFFLVVFTGFMKCVVLYMNLYKRTTYSFAWMHFISHVSWFIPIILAVTFTFAISIDWEGIRIKLCILLSYRQLISCWVFFCVIRDPIFLRKSFCCPREGHSQTVMDWMVDETRDITSQSFLFLPFMTTRLLVARITTPYQVCFSKEWGRNHWFLLSTLVLYSSGSHQLFTVLYCTLPNHFRTRIQ